ncbi:hypothetical protein Y699_01464 [Aspergillus fumigatus Z5]|nr:hypothetical protein Y699_01464 [Aspergillus fumigatus Z5]
MVSVQQCQRRIRSDTSLQTLLWVLFIAEHPGSGWMESLMDRCPLHQVVISFTATSGTMVPRVTEQRTTPRPSIEPFLMAIAANTVLPTTVVTSNGKTQTFSEDRIPSLTDLTTTTKVTTTLSENEIQTATSTTTLIPVIFPVTKGGFYWSPVPEPTAPEFPIPSLPDFPPVPSSPCFKLGDLFSRNCPPNDNKAPQTTHFTRGPNSPSCRSNCGHLRSETDSSSSSSCTTQNVTSCPKCILSQIFTIANHTGTALPQAQTPAAPQRRRNACSMRSFG